jgi:aminoglycoside phosphotransferase family enzyme
MDILLKAGEVDTETIEAIADVLIPFHRSASRIAHGDDAESLFAEYADIQVVFDELEKLTGAGYSTWITSTFGPVSRLLHDFSFRLKERHEEGFVIDGHGDLHCRNILLEDPPVIFDCLEFSDDFRQLDILSELAFLCMDLERFNREDLSDHFLQYYLQHYACLKTDIDERLFLFYKMHRAGVQLKVHVIRASESVSEKERELLTERVHQFFKLLTKYYSRLSN